MDAAGQSCPTAPLMIGVVSQILHGLCYACFFASAFMYVDRVADEDIRNSAQTVFGIIILGVGPMIAGPALGILGNVFGEAGVVTNFAGMWFTLAAIALLTAALVGTVRDETRNSYIPAARSATATGGSTSEATPQVSVPLGRFAGVFSFAAQSQDIPA